MSPLLLMPPRDRLLPNAYPLVSALFSRPMATCTEFTSYICKKMFVDMPHIAKYLPFQDKIDIWDFEYACRIEEEERINSVNVPFQSVTRVTIEYGGEQVQAFSIVDAQASVPRRRLPLPAIDDDPDGEDEYDDEESNGHVMIYYTCTEIRTRQVRRRAYFHIPNLRNLSEAEIKDAINEQISAGDFSCTHIREVQSLQTRFEDREYYSFTVEDDSDNEIDSDLSSITAREIFDENIDELN